MKRLRVAAATTVIAAAVALSSGAQPPRFDDLHRMLPWDATGDAYAVALGDVDGDGDLDAVFGIATESSFSNPIFRNRLYLNGGLGAFRVAPSSLPPTVEDTYGAALGDVDRDGDLDLLFGNDGPETVYLNDGSGVFAATAGQIPAASDDTRALALGDLDGDGDLDALVGNFGQSRLYLNDGSGVFADATPQLPAVDDSTNGLALGDLDGDGDLDALLANLGVPRLYLNDGSGTFANAPSQIPAQFYGQLRAVGVGDVDGDGDLDAVLGGPGLFPPFTTPGPVVLFRNAGPALFTGVVLPFSASTSSLALGDVDGDGDLDVLVGDSGACGEFGCGSGQDSLLVNGGTGTFTNASSQFPATPTWTNAVALGDVDGDGDLDALLGTGYFADHASELLLNDGAGTFREATGGISTASLPVASVALGDLDGDGDLDVFTGGLGQDGYLNGVSRVLLNDGAGLLEPGPAQPAGFENAGDVALGDVDGDGDLDALVPATPGYFPSSDRLFLNDGTGAFAVALGQFPQTGLAASAAALRDMDGDGDLDALVGSHASPGLLPPYLRLYVNAGAGAFSFAAGAFPAGTPHAGTFSVGDVDGDGNLDVLAADYGNCPPAASSCPGAPSRLYLNAGGGVFVDASAQLPPNADVTVSVALGDVDGDGDLDAYLGNGLPPPGPKQDRLFLNDGAGVFSDATGQVPVESDSAGPVSLLDVDGDGDLDAWIAEDPLPRLSMNDGSGVFSDAGLSLPVGWSRATDIATGDLDGDGDPDVVLADAGRIRVLSNLERQLAWRALPRVGKPLVLDLHGPAWGGWFLGLALGTANVPIPPFGTLRIDPTLTFPPLGGIFDAQGRAAVTNAVPPSPSLVGATLYWQALVVGAGYPRFTNLETTTFTNL
ncbi:MAG TPA: VCBS repeat-containing protein [Planctomycetota bacterium]|jgi:hypothetical protein|nr:VCBS repeat-containing protein [Planctomycetota bacterium]